MPISISDKCAVWLPSFKRSAFRSATRQHSSSSAQKLTFSNLTLEALVSFGFRVSGVTRDISKYPIPSICIRHQSLSQSTIERFNASSTATTSVLVNVQAISFTISQIEIVRRLQYGDNNVVSSSILEGIGTGANSNLLAINNIFFKDNHKNPQEILPFYN